MTKSNKNPNDSIQFISDHINKEYFTFLNSFDRLISRNLRNADIKTRAAKSNGLWCCGILPTVLISYNCLYKVSPVYSQVACISLGLLFYCLLFLVFLSVSCLVLQDQVYGGCIASSFVSALLLYIFLGKDLTDSLLFTVPTVFAFSTLLRISLINFPKTFTIGEAMIVVQSIVLYIAMTFLRIFDDTVNENMDFITAIINTVLSTVAIIVTALNVIPNKQKNLRNLGYVVLGAVMFGTLMLHSLLGIHCIMRIFYYVFMDARRAKLFTFWLALVLISIAVLCFRTKLAVKANTVTRKSFHVLASIVFLSGILCDQTLMMMAAGVGFGLLVLVEALRKSGIEPISSTLQSAFIVYSDEKLLCGNHELSLSKKIFYKKILSTSRRNLHTPTQNKKLQDSGSFAMTPFYLYCGLACPLLLVPTHAGCQLELLSGVLSIGVGDTAASWFGSRYGFNKWPDSSKSLEGTAFNILSQIMTVYALLIFDLIDARYVLVRTAIVATIAGLVEALTDQVDNLVLPLITIIAFQMTWSLC